MKYDADKTVVEQKCPITLKSFCQLVDPLYEGKTGMDAINHIRENHKDGEKYYWQMVSNACITGAKYAELIVYVPYFDELEAVRELVRNTDEGIQSQFAWINFADDRELPYLVEGAYYKNLNVIRFEVPLQDKALLRVKVEIAGKLLTKIA
jgi:hypothetical protein